MSTPNVSTEITATNTAAGVQLSISGDLDFVTARQTLAELSAHILQNPQLTVDLSAIRNSNSAGLAVVLESLAIAERQGHKIEFQNIPEPLIQLSNVCQVNSLI